MSIINEQEWNEGQIDSLRHMIDQLNRAVEASGAGDHGALSGLTDDDHSQYHNDTRGDARYYTETELDAGQLDTIYYTETEMDAGQMDTRYYTEAEVDGFTITKWSGALPADQGGVEGVAILPTLPDAAYPVGAVVFLTSDEKLYRNASDVWTAAVATSDLSGNIDLDTQVSGTLSTSFAEAGLINTGVTINADGTLTGAGAGQVSLTSLPGSVVAGQIASNAVTSVKINALAITAAKIATSTITATQMASNAITADKILAGAVTAAKIAAAVITADKLAASLTFTNELLLSTTGKIRVGKSSASDTTSGLWFGTDGSGGWDLHVGDTNGYLWWDDSINTLSIKGVIDMTNSVSTFTPTWTGFSTAPTGDLSYLNFGAYVVIWNDQSARTGTSNATTMTISAGVPAAIQPSATRFMWTGVVDNGGNAVGTASVSTGGVITFFVGSTYPYLAANSFTNPGTNGIPAGWILMYAL